VTLLPFCEWLASTRGSIALHESLLVYPLIESMHVLTLSWFLGMTALLDLRLLGLVLRRVPVSEMTRRIVPLMIAGFVVMVATGLLLFYAIPVRSYQSLFLRLKLVALVLAGLNVWVFYRTVHRRVSQWDLDRAPPKKARIAALVSLFCWSLVVMSGRLAAYSWFDCDQQPQPAIVNWAAGCVVGPS
jgi:Family of unknown function (DUF6644)